MSERLADVVCDDITAPGHDPPIHAEDESDCDDTDRHRHGRECNRRVGDYGAALGR